MQHTFYILVVVGLMTTPSGHALLVKDSQQSRFTVLITNMNSRIILFLVKRARVSRPHDNLKECCVGQMEERVFELIVQASYVEKHMNDHKDSSNLNNIYPTRMRI